MIEVKYRNHFELADMAGRTIDEVRAHFKGEFGIPDKAVAKLNGKKINSRMESEITLSSDDRLVFAAKSNRSAYMVCALLGALAVTGSAFAYGFINNTTSLNASISNSNYADVTTNASASNITWSAFGNFKGSIDGPNGLFNVEPAANYNGDLVVTVTLGNADLLAKDYRVLALKLDMIDSAGNVIDINESGTANSADWVMLTLDNGAVSMFPRAVTSNMTVRVVSGFYITHVNPNGGFTGSASPDLFCEVAQR
jgi:hypothetical protein